MKILHTDYNIVKNRKGEYWHNLDGAWQCEGRGMAYIRDIYHVCKKKYMSEARKTKLVEELIAKYKVVNTEVKTAKDAATELATDTATKTISLGTSDGLYSIDPGICDSIDSSIYDTASAFVKRMMKDTITVDDISTYSAEDVNLTATAIDDMVEEKPAHIIATATCEKLIDFFKEFDFEPNFRFVNTLAKKCIASSTEAKAYVANYFALTDNSYATAIVNKMESIEFSHIMENLCSLNTSKTINSRFKVYYGSQGTGKTTLAMSEADNNCMVCHSAMLPSDLMEDFKFVDGKAEFAPSKLYQAITEGNIIVLDEINLLPFESLRFLQSILDGKSQFTYKGKDVIIANGFKIIGTMNLHVNGMSYALPEPLVDRAEDLKEFKLTADQLMSAII